MVFSFLHCRFVLRVTFVLLSGIDLVEACSVLSFLCVGGWHLPIPLDFLFWIRAPELASLFPQLLWFYKGHLRSFLLCFSFSRLLWVFPIPLSWAEQNNFPCERALNYLPLPPLQWCLCFLLVGSLKQKDEFLLGFSLVFVFGALFLISGFNVNMCCCAELNRISFQ